MSLTRVSNPNTSSKSDTSPSVPSTANLLLIRKTLNLLILLAVLLFLWLVAIPFSAWLFNVHSNDSTEINWRLTDEEKVRNFLRNEIEKFLNHFQLTCKSNQQCMPYQSYVSKNEHEQDMHRILSKYSSHWFSWFDNGKKMQMMLDQALRKYDSDNIALADYALESVGGSVLVKYSSKTFTDRSATFNIFSLPIMKRVVSPNTILRKGTMPGNCWPMMGSDGYVMISLPFPVRPTMFTLEHLPKTLSFDGQSRSAPKHFSVRGLNSVDQEGEFLGRFIYDTTTIDSSHIQTFHVQSKNNLGFYPLIRLTIESNWGQPEYTCIYRFRVHGQPELPPSY